MLHALERRSSRDARAMGKRGRHGRKVQEAEWKNAEGDALYRLVGANVRVPAPHLVHEGVLLMELVRDEHGHPAPRLNDVDIILHHHTQPATTAGTTPDYSRPCSSSKCRCQHGIER